MTALRERLLEVFEVEYREHIEAMRTILAARALDARTLGEAMRRAHTLKGAARAVGLSEVEALAHGLESLFAKASTGDGASDAEMRRRIADALNEIEDGVAASSRAATGTLPYAEDAGPREAPAAIRESVRVGAVQIDELFGSVSELHGEVFRQGEIAGRAHDIAAEATALAAHWERLRRAGDAPINDELRSLIQGLEVRSRVAAAMQAAAANQLRGHVRRLDARVRSAGMLRAESVFGSFRKMVRDLAAEEGKEVDFAIDGFDCAADRMVLQRIKDPVMHLLRNAVSHGIETPGERRAAGKPPEGRVRFAISAERGRLSIVVEDDGRGIDFAAVAARGVGRGLISADAAAQASQSDLAQLLFAPGFSMASEVTRLSGRGVGLSVAREAVADLDGTIALVPIPGGGTRIDISVPLSILARRLLIASFREHDVAIPCDMVAKALRVPVSDVISLEGRPAILHDGAPIPIRSLGELLALPDAAVALDAANISILVMRGPAGHTALAVERFGGVGDFAVRPLDVATGDWRVWGGVTMAPNGAPCLVLGGGALAQLGAPAAVPLTFGERSRTPERPRVLVVDDSVTTRTLEKSILEAEGFQVRLSVDGADAIAQLRAEPADLVVSDIEMPRLDGFQLLRAMKDDEALAAIPVILVTSRESAADRERGMQLGADAYVVKQKFDQVELLKTIRQVI